MGYVHSSYSLVKWPIELDRMKILREFHMTGEGCKFKLR